MRSLFKVLGRKDKIKHVHEFPCLFRRGKTRGKIVVKNNKMFLLAQLYENDVVFLSKFLLRGSERKGGGICRSSSVATTILYF